MLIDQLQVWILAGSGALLLAAMLAAYFVRRRRRLDPDAEVDPTVGRFRTSHPAFYRIMRSFQRHYDLAEILSRGEVRDAFRLLQRHADGGQSPPAAGNTLRLNGLTGKLSDERVQAAMLTILRSIYMDERFVAQLDPEVHRELDQLLDTLSGPA